MTAGGTDGRQGGLDGRQGGLDGRRGCDDIAPYGTGNFTKKKGQFYTARGIGLHSTRRRATQHAASGYTARGVKQPLMGRILLCPFPRIWSYEFLAFTARVAL